MNTNMIEEALEQWQTWLDENPDTNEHYLSYALGVIDGLRYALHPVPVNEFKSSRV